VKFGCWRAVRLLIATGLVVGTCGLCPAADVRADFGDPRLLPLRLHGARPWCPASRRCIAPECLKRNAAKVSPSCKAALDAVGPPPTESAAPAPAPPKPAPAPAAAAPPPPAAAAPPPPPATAEPSAATAEPAAPPPPGPPAAEGKKPPSPQVAAVRAACRSDFGVHCPGVKPGGSAALRCQQAKAAALSPPCRKAVMAMGEDGAPPPAAGAAPPPTIAPLGPMRPRKALEVLSFCGAEQRTLCANVPPGGGRIIECLAANYARLSPECYGALARAAR
jgi:hypothetical protein